MRYAAVFLLTVSVGCTWLGHRPAGPCSVPVGTPCGPAVVAHAPSGPAPCPPPACPPAPCPQKREAPAQPREVPPVERTTSRAAVTQDVLLIPRMVYVPYAPQVPVAPARLGVTAPAERMLTEETTRQVAPRDVPPPPRDRSAEALDKCARLLEQLDARLRALESAPRPVCPPPAAPCPTRMPGGTVLPDLPSPHCVTLPPIQ